MTFAYLILGIGIGYISSKVNDKREKIKKIHSTISVYTPSFIKSWYETIKTVVKIQLDGFYNDVQDNVIKRVKTARKITPCLLDNFEKREIHEIDYYFKGKKYKFHFEESVSNSCIDVYDGEGNNITSKFLEYLGPSNDFHGKKYTPRILGYSKIIIFDDDLNQKVYEIDDPIEIYQSPSVSL